MWQFAVEFSENILFLGILANEQRAFPDKIFQIISRTSDAIHRMSCESETRFPIRYLRREKLKIKKSALGQVKK
jgi:hypothetical protein